MQIVQIALGVSMYTSFDYISQTHQPISQQHFGCRVVVPFGTRKQVGIIIGIGENTVEIHKLKTIEKVLDDTPTFSSQLMQLLDWASQYYFYPIGLVYQTALPVLLRKPTQKPKITNWQICDDKPVKPIKLSPNQKNAFDIIQSHKQISTYQLLRLGVTLATITALEKKHCIYQNDKIQSIHKNIVDPVIQPNDEQKHVIKTILAAQQNFSVFALQGVTGSGKTLVYLQIIQKLNEQNKQALLLVPEIGLTPQTLRIFTNSLTKDVLMMHSHMSDQERLHAWCDAQKPQCGLLIGTRSALFCPMPQLGIIIIDEEHDASFKQNDGFRYHARDLAIKRGQLENIPIVLGSATLSLETMFNVQLQKFTPLQLRTRASADAPIRIRMIDRASITQNKQLHPQTLKAMQKHIAAGNHVLVFINRRGYAPSLRCAQCQWCASCENCDSLLTLHQKNMQMRCHYCAAVKQVPQQCPNCVGYTLIAVGAGSQRIEQVLQRHFDAKNILRIDSDTMQQKNAFDDLHTMLANSQGKILVGTQMLAKGHDYHKITLVVVIDSDSAFFSSDFKAAERSAQTLMQVIGRAGRGKQQGEAYIQTSFAEHPIMQGIAQQDYVQISQNILAQRQQMAFPPTRFMALIRAENTNETIGQDFLAEIKQLVHTNISNNIEVEIYGPSQPMQSKLNKNYRWQLIFFAKKRSHLHQLLYQYQTQILQHRLRQKVRWSINVDPGEIHY